MNRDMDLIRKILLTLKQAPDGKTIPNLKIEGYDENTVAYHCKLLYENGLISSYKRQDANNKIYIFWVGNLTWDGHDFLAKIEDEKVWKKVWKTISDKGLNATFDVIKSIAIKLLAENIL